MASSSASNSPRPASTAVRARRSRPGRPPAQSPAMTCAFSLPSGPHWSQRTEFNQAGCASADRVAANFLLEQAGGDVSIRAQPDLVTLDFRDEALRDVVVMLLMADAAVGADELDAIVLDTVDGAEMHAIGADHFHMLTNVLEAAHDLLLAGPGCNALLAPRVHRRGDRLRLFRRRVIHAGGFSRRHSRLATRAYARGPHNNRRRFPVHSRSPAIAGPCRDPPRGLSAARLAGARHRARLRPG